MTGDGAVAALILAGERPGGDPLAAAEGVASKAAIRVEGETMLARVAATLRAVPAVGPITVCGPEGLEMPAVDGLHRVAAEAGPSRSVAAAVERAPDRPLLVATADHPLLRPDWVAEFFARLPPEADAAAALASADTVRRDVPDTRRTFLRFADGAWSGCNLFFFAGARALPLLRFWERVEADRKRPLRLLAAVGPGVLLDRFLGRLTLARALDRLGRRTGTRLAAVELGFGEAAVDVDKPDDLALVRRILAARRAAAGAPEDAG